MWKMLIYTATGVLFTEIAYLLYKYSKKKKNASDHDDENDVNCVIWTNELTQNCVHAHNLQIELNLTPIKRSNGLIKNSECSNPHCARANIGFLLDCLDSAKYSIDLAMYTFTSIEMSNAVHRALRRNVIVRIITDKEMAYSTGSQITDLTKFGAPVRHPLNNALMHHKFCIIDGDNRVAQIMEIDKVRFEPKSVKSIVLNGSLNWTSQALNGNWENVVITSNKSLVKQFEREFERMWIAFAKMSLNQ